MAKRYKIDNKCKESVWDVLKNATIFHKYGVLDVESLF